MILAAGRGERMRPLTDTMPKPLQLVKGKTLIERHVEALARAGVEHIVINLSWLGHLIEKALGDGSRFQVTIDYSVEESALGTLGGIVNALPLLQEEQFLVLSADIFTDFDFQPLLNRSLENQDVAHLVLIEKSPFEGDFSLHLDRVQEPNQTAYTYGNMGLYQRQALTAFPSGQVLDLGQYLRQAVARQQVSGQLFTGLWSNIGTINELTRINQLMSR
ncbi:MAG: hypothetical protein B7Z60_02795 [Ferrovum sp. 37-45-19]|nr:D-glycero-alpha-D-manno-heptose 1-phosphate guanylyltransferase [Ferrovum sp. JA12]OYV80579.1 MAG: hypothetical protein B7Z65_00865 [Ferrovum sp. 21-44-67]OYV94925.1 MAG: hypothetical protein B7Z60_02795 [Ferrovum sp. 37-45-19]OZB31926.1 MAG: hypothetical protein B7X47_08085 [Ferrovum sp. 34-44-207]